MKQNLSFYQPLRNGDDQPSKINTVGVNGPNIRSYSDECNIETIETEEEVPQNDNTVGENAVDEKVQCVLLPSLHHCTNHLAHLKCPPVNCYAVLDQSRTQTSVKVSLQLLVQ